MAESKPWGVLDPNSQHQLWSHWTFTIYEGGRHAPYADVVTNARHWIRAGFGTVGECRVCERLVTARGSDDEAFLQQVYIIEARVEGVPAHDPGYVASVRRQFLQRFVAPGWGPLAAGDVQVKVLAGDTQDGKPRAQLIVMPSIVP